MRIRPTLLISFLAAAFTLSGQERASATPPAAPNEVKNSQEAFKSSVNEVIVPVTVTDMNGRFVSNLEKKDFQIFEEGKEQKVTFFTRERNQPVVIGFLVDLSNRSRLHWDKFKEAIQDLVLATMEPEGKPDERFAAYMIGYSTEAELSVNTTNNPEPILDKVRKIKAGGGSALYDAVHMACTSRTLVKGEPIEPRRVIIVVGDGNDNSSKYTLDQVVELAQRNLVTIYGVSTVGFGFTSEGERNLKRLAESTGGRVVYPLENVYSDVSGYLSKPSDEGNYAIKVGTGGYAAAIMKGIVNAIEATAGEINTQYIMRYVPADTDVSRTFRRIEVKVNLPNVKIRAREGYYPFPAN